MNSQSTKHLITFLPSRIQVEVSDSCTLLDAANQAGLSPDAPCGGNGTCGKCLVNLHTENGLVKVRACSVHADKPMTVELINADQKVDILTDTVMCFRDVPVISPLPIPGVSSGYLSACDLGSTTIVLYLLDSISGKLLATISAQNPQTSYAADVIGRIAYAQEHGPEHLTESVRKTIAGLLTKACLSANIDPHQVTHLCLAGNCCMHHLYFGFPTDSLAVIPYAPSVTEALVLPARDYGLPMHPQGIIEALPNIAGFVGADTVACLSAVSFDTLEDITLLLDIGTNGELVLGNKRKRLTCSTAAGPALEGARITCGMRGTVGAIDHVRLENDKIVYSVIGQDMDSQIVPKGFCGSGLIDAVSLFLDLEILDDSGRFTDHKCWPDPSAYAHMDNLDAYTFTDTVYITQKDIREIQLAKAAIAAGIQLMCDQLGITPSQIKHVLIAGAFGNYMDPSSACRIGLIPPILEDRIHPVGNAAGAGACRCVCDQDAFERAKKMASETQFLELASLDEFQDVFVDELGFENE